MAKGRHSPTSFRSLGELLPPKSCFWTKDGRHMEKLGFLDEWSPCIYSGAGQESLQGSDKGHCPWGCTVELV